jgi:hypothetical protein
VVEAKLPHLLLLYLKVDRLKCPIQRSLSDFQQKILAARTIPSILKKALGIRKEENKEKGSLIPEILWPLLYSRQHVGTLFAVLSLSLYSL